MQTENVIFITYEENTSLEIEHNWGKLEWCQTQSLFYALFRLELKEYWWLLLSKWQSQKTKLVKDSRVVYFYYYVWKRGHCVTFFQIHVSDRDLFTLARMMSKAVCFLNPIQIGSKRSANSSWNTILKGKHLKIILRVSLLSENPALPVCRK